LQQLRLAVNAMVQQTERDTNITLKPEAKENIANAINQHY
jgi:hypothetical protein